MDVTELKTHLREVHGAIEQEDGMEQEADTVVYGRGLSIESLTRGTQGSPGIAGRGVPQTVTHIGSDA